MDSLVEEFRLNEIETTEMGKHPLVRFCLEHEDNCRFACCCMLKGKLISEGRLPGPRIAGNEIGISCEQSAIQEAIQTFDACPQARVIGVAADTNDAIRHDGESPVRSERDRRSRPE